MKIFDECNSGENEIDKNYIVNQETTEILVKTFISEFNYTKKHASLYTNQNYTIIIYENRECVTELNLDMPKVDFKECYEKVKNEYNIDEELIISIINKKDKNGGQTYSSFYHPIYGFKLNAEEICKNETIEVKENLTSILSEKNENYETQTFLTEQGINIFDLNDPFYTDLCYDYDNPHYRDIPLNDRIATVYPDIPLCDEGCRINRIDLDTMTSSCDCKFNDISNSNIIKDNALLENVMGEVFDIINASNILVMKCYKYTFKYFTNSVGGIISTIALAGHLISSVIYFLVGAKNIKIYIYSIYEKFLSLIGKNGIDTPTSPPKRNIKNKSLKDEIIQNKKEVRFNAAVKNKENKKVKKKDFDSYSSIAKRKIKKEKPLLTNFDSKKSFKDVMIFREKFTKEEKIERNILTEKSKNSIKLRKKPNLILKE